MESIVVVQYPLGTETVTLDQLLDWELWPSYIKIFSELSCNINLKGDMF